MNIYSIKNEKLGFFNRPIYCESYQEALTYIQNILASDADRALKGLRGDLSLYFLGTIDFTTGDIFPAYQYIDRYDESVEVKQAICICTLDEIFDSIPDESIVNPITEALKVRNELIEKYDAAFEELKSELESKIENLKFKKGKK